MCELTGCIWGQQQGLLQYLKRKIINGIKDQGNQSLRTFPPFLLPLGVVCLGATDKILTGCHCPDPMPMFVR